MAFCSSRLEPNIHTGHWGETLTSPYHRPISSVLLTAAHSRELWLRGTFPDKALWWLLPKNVTSLWSFALFNQCTVRRTNTFKYLGSVPSSARLILRQTSPNQSNQARSVKERRRKEIKENKGLNYHSPNILYVQAPWEKRRWNICKPVIQLWNNFLKSVVPLLLVFFFNSLALLL